MADENPTLTPEQMAARIAELEGRLSNTATLRFKVSEKERSRSMVWAASR